MCYTNYKIYQGAIFMKNWYRSLVSPYKELVRILLYDLIYLLVYLGAELFFGSFDLTSLLAPLILIVMSLIIWLTIYRYKTKWWLRWLIYLIALFGLFSLQSLLIGDWYDWTSFLIYFLSAVVLSLILLVVSIVWETKI